MKFKFGVKQIVLIVVAVVLIAGLIVGNYFINANKISLNNYFGGGNAQSSSDTYSSGDALVPELVEDSAVLLRNETKSGTPTLPLDPTNDRENKVNLFGWNSTDAGYLLSGTGSGGSPVLEQNRVTISQAFKDAGYEINEELLADYASQSGAGSDTINHVGQQSTQSMAAIYNPGESFYTDERMSAAKDFSDVAIVVLSRNTGENCGGGETLNVSGYANGAWLELTANEKTMLEYVTTYFSSGKVIVLLNTTNTMELGFLEDYGIDAAMYIGATGQSGARAIPNLLYGQKTVKASTEDEESAEETVVQFSPSGRTSDTYAYNYNLVDGKAYSPSWASTVNNGNSLYYQEGIYVGYKWYETADVEGFFDDVTTEYGSGYDGIVQYPFGYGLSYTEFEWSVDWPDQNTVTADGEYTVEVTVRNTGDYPGKDVVELYFTPPYTDGGIEKSAMNLLAFAKTPTLNPGNQITLELKFSAYDLASYDCYDANDNGFYGYELDGGTYEIKLMSDAHHTAPMAGSSRNQSEMTCAASGIQIANDPVTGTAVENQFTTVGEYTAYSGTPIDGSSAFSGGIDYLSRANAFANFPSATTYTCKGLSNRPNQEFSGEDKWNDLATAEFDNIQYGVDAGRYLLTKADGSKPTRSDLNGEGEQLVYNTELMEILKDYDAEEWDEFLDQLTQNEINQLIGQGQFQTVLVESVGKPFCNEYDGPSGFNLNSQSAPSLPEWVVFPVEILLGCSWNVEVTHMMGAEMGKIGQATGVHGWYGPGLNLHRSPYYGRNFEYYSEDPVLTGHLAAACVKGAKENDLAAYMKHFACADTGPNSPNWYTWLTEQTLRESYLKPFEIAVKEGGANAAMSGFSAVGATWAGSNWALTTQVLRNEWGFRGTVITDWQNNYMDKLRGIFGGNDLWLGGNAGTFNFDDPEQAYCARQSAKNILYTYIDCHMTVADPNEGPNIVGSKTSGLFIFIWVLFNVLLIAGIALCVVFFIISPKQMRAAKAAKKAQQNGDNNVR